jgi:hypothetical protein
MQCAAVDDRIMTNRNVIPDSSPKSLVSTMDTSAVLYIHLVPHPDKIYIATNNRIEPDTAIIAHYDITNYSGVRRQKTIAAKPGEFIFYWKYYRHISVSGFFKSMVNGQLSMANKAIMKVNSPFTVNHSRLQIREFPCAFARPLRSLREIILFESAGAFS